MTLPNIVCTLTLMRTWPLSRFTSQLSRCASAALVTVNHVGARMVLDGPRPVGEASGYAGHRPDPEPTRGRWTVAYPDTPPLDQDAPPGDEAVEVIPARRLQALG